MAARKFEKRRHFWRGLRKVWGFRFDPIDGELLIKTPLFALWIAEAAEEWDRDSIFNGIMFSFGVNIAHGGEGAVWYRWRWQWVQRICREMLEAPRG